MLFTYLDLKDALIDKATADVQIPGIELLVTIKDLLEDFKMAMADDFNTANAITAMYAMVKLANKSLRTKESDLVLLELLKAFEQMFTVLGFVYNKERMRPEDKALYKSWEQARADKNFVLADELRGRLQERALI
jgi:cysteinyl-tRNA synthetase